MILIINDLKKKGNLSDFSGLNSGDGVFLSVTRLSVCVCRSVTVGRLPQFKTLLMEEYGDLSLVEP